MTQDLLTLHAPRQAEPSHRVPELLARIEAHPLDKPGAAFPFSDRLAQENGWPASFALRVIEEYRRFVYLACVADEELTPSDEVDQVWHLHLAYTRDYWDEFCPKVLGRPLHHGPTDGSSAEDQRHEANYGRTLVLYERIFGERPPPDIWPPDPIRFDYAPGNARVNKLLFSISPKKRKTPAILQFAFSVATIFVTLGVLVILPPSASSRNTFELHFWWFCYFFLAVAWGQILFFVLAALRRTFRIALSQGQKIEVITQPQHGYSVAFTVAMTPSAGAAQATVSDFEVIDDLWSRRGGGAGAGFGGGGGSGCGGGGGGCSGGGG